MAPLLHIDQVGNAQAKRSNFNSQAKRSNLQPNGVNDPIGVLGPGASSMMNDDMLASSAKRVAMTFFDDQCAIGRAGGDIAPNHSCDNIMWSQQLQRVRLALQHQTIRVALHMLRELRWQADAQACLQAEFRPYLHVHDEAPAPIQFSHAFNADRPHRMRKAIASCRNDARRGLVLGGDVYEAEVRSAAIACISELEVRTLA